MAGRTMGVAEAAALLGVDRTRVQQLARQGKLAGTKVDGEWLLDEESVVARSNRRRPAVATVPAPPAATTDAPGRHDEVEFLRREVHSLELELMRRERDDAVARAERAERRLDALGPLVEQVLALLRET